MRYVYTNKKQKNQKKNEIQIKAGGCLKVFSVGFGVKCIVHMMFDVYKKKPITSHLSPTDSLLHKNIGTPLYRRQCVLGACAPVVGRQCASLMRHKPRTIYTTLI